MFPVSSASGFVVPPLPYSAGTGTVTAPGLANASTNQMRPGIVPQALFAVADGKAVPLTPIYSGMDGQQANQNIANTMMLSQQPQQLLAQTNNSGVGAVSIGAPPNATARLMAPIRQDTAPLMANASPVLQNTVQTGFNTSPQMFSLTNSALPTTLTTSSNPVPTAVFMAQGAILGQTGGTNTNMATHINNTHLYGEPRVIRNNVVNTAPVPLLLNQINVRPPTAVTIGMTSALSSPAVQTGYGTLGTNQPAVQVNNRVQGDNSNRLLSNQIVVDNMGSVSVGRFSLLSSQNSQQLPASNPMNVASTTRNVNNGQQMILVSNNQRGKVAGTPMPVLNNNGLQFAAGIPSGIQQVQPSIRQQTCPQFMMPTEGPRSVVLAPGNALIMPHNKVQQVKKINSNQTFVISPQRTTNPAFVNNSNPGNNGNTNLTTVRTQGLPSAANGMPIITNVHSLAAGLQQGGHGDERNRPPPPSYSVAATGNKRSAPAFVSSSVASQIVRVNTTGMISSSPQTQVRNNVRVNAAATGVFNKNPQQQLVSNAAVMSSARPPQVVGTSCSVSASNTVTPALYNVTYANSAASHISRSVASASTRTVSSVSSSALSSAAASSSATGPATKTVLINMVQSSSSGGGSSIPTSQLMSILRNTMSLPGGALPPNVHVMVTNHSARPLTSSSVNSSSYRLANPAPRGTSMNANRMVQQGLRPYIIRTTTARPQSASTNLVTTATTNRNTPQLMVSANGTKLSGDKPVKFTIMNGTSQLPCTIQSSEVWLETRGIRIGSLRGTAYSPVKILNSEINIFVRVRNQTNFAISLKSTDLLTGLANYDKVPMLFIFTTPSGAEKIQKLCNTDMVHFNPRGTSSVHKFVMISLASLSADQVEILQELKIAPDKRMFLEVNHNTVMEILSRIKSEDLKYYQKVMGKTVDNSSNDQGSNNSNRKTSTGTVDISDIINVDGSNNLQFIEKELSAADEDSDDDVIMVSEARSAKCPYTQQIMKYPVKNTHCGHNYDQHAVLEMIRVKKGVAKCPVLGCSNPIPLLSQDLLYDEELMEYIKNMDKDNS